MIAAGIFHIARDVLSATDSSVLALFVFSGLIFGLWGTLKFVEKDAYNLAKKYNQYLLKYGKEPW